MTHTRPVPLDGRSPDQINPRFRRAGCRRLIGWHAAGRRRGCGQDGGQGQTINETGSGKTTLYPQSDRARVSDPDAVRDLHTDPMGPDGRQHLTACHRTQSTNACMIGSVHRRIVLHYVSVGSREQALDRISNRVALGGHDVPEVDVRRRFTRSHTNVPAAMARADLTGSTKTPIPAGRIGRLRSSGTGSGGSQRMFRAGRKRFSLSCTVVDVGGSPCFAPCHDEVGCKERCRPLRDGGR